VTRVALRGIRAHIVQFLLSVLAVALGVAFVAGTFSLRTMMSSTFGGIVERSTVGDAYVRGSQVIDSVAQDGTGLSVARNTIPAALATSIQGMDGVRYAFPSISGPLVLVGADGTAVASGTSPTFGIALDPSDPTIKVVTGRIPHGPNEIGLDSGAMSSSRLTVGDHTKVILGGQLRNVEVVAHLSLGAPMAGATIVYVDVPTAMAAFAADGKVTNIAVYAEDGVSQTALVRRIAPMLSTTTTTTTAATAEVVTGDTARAETAANIEDALGFMQTFMLIFAGISLFVAAFIISNTFSMSVRQRMREFALMRAVGASPPQVFASILIQATIVGLAGSALGLLAGIGLVSLLRIAFLRFGLDLSGSIPLDASTIITSLAVGTLVSAAAAVLPARHAALTPPVQAMHDTVVTGGRSLRRRALAGAMLMGAGAIAVISAMARPTPHGPTMLGAGAAALVIGVLVLAPVIVARTLNVLAAGFVAAVKPLGRLARGNVTRNPRRTANTAGALMIGMVLVGAASVLAASATTSTRSAIANESTADFIVQSATHDVPDGAIRGIASLDSVAATDVARNGRTGVTRADATATPDDTMSVVGLPAAAFGRSLNVRVLSGSFDALAHGAIAVQESTATDHRWSVGTQVRLTPQNGAAPPVRATIGAIIDSKSLGAPVILPEGIYAQVIAPAQSAANTVFVTATPGTTAAALRSDLVSIAKPYVVLSVLDNDQFAAKLAEQVTSLLVILYALLGLSIIIAILGIVNTLALSVIERTREIGLMRAVGLGRLQLAGILTIESVLTALFGTIIGLTLGVAIAAALPTVFASAGLTLLAIPWSQLAAMLALAVAVGVLAALWPAMRAARLPVLEAITSE
jgi:putative ABC transport system permease protein